MRLVKILVPIKRVIDSNVRIRIKPDASGIERAGVKMSMNPFDEIALEEAIRLKEKGIGTEILAVSIGQADVVETLRTGLAMGADRALHISAPSDPLDSLTIAKILKAVVTQEAPALVMMGKQAIDDDCGQTGVMLAGLLNWPQGTCASKVDVDADGRSVTVTREVDRGLETLQLALPAVITADLRLNTPRYIALPNIMKARQKPIEAKSLEELSVSTPAYKTILKVFAPPARRMGQSLSSAEELVSVLRNAGVLNL